MKLIDDKPHVYVEASFDTSPKTRNDDSGRPISELIEWLKQFEGLRECTVKGWSYYDDRSDVEETSIDIDGYREATEEEIERDRRASEKIAETIRLREEAEAKRRRQDAERRLREIVRQYPDIDIPRKVF